MGDEETYNPCRAATRRNSLTMPLRTTLDDLPALVFSQGAAPRKVIMDLSEQILPLSTLASAIVSWQCVPCPLENL